MVVCACHACALHTGDHLVHHSTCRNKRSKTATLVGSTEHDELLMQSNPSQPNKQPEKLEACTVLVHAEIIYSAVTALSC